MSASAPGAPAPDATDADPAGPGAGLAAERVSLRDAARRLAEGDLGSLRVVLVLVVIWTIFTIANDRFLTAVNLTNLALQIAAVGTISVGVVLVLLLGEIDLSVGAVSGLAAAVTATLSVKSGWGAWPAILAGLAVGATIGLLQGTLSTRLGIPSFVVTLAGLLGWQGALLAVLGSDGTVNISDPGITNLAGTFFSDVVGWLVAAVCIAAIALSTLGRRRRRLAAGLEVEPVAAVALRVGAAAAGILAAVAIVNADRGLPLALVILVGLVVLVQGLITRTTYGKHVFAVGGNAEAARRAGISVDRIRMSVFIVCSSLAALSGIIAASYAGKVSASSGAGNTLLYAVGAAVIGGTSLFGGKGRALDAVIGGVVVATIANGLGLLNQSSYINFLVTGGVLLLAASVDAISRRRRSATGLS